MSRRAGERVSIVAAGLLACLGAKAQPSPTSHAEFLVAAKATLASQIEPSLPEIPVDAWLASVVGPSVPLSWAINDCGEQTGVPEIDSKRDLPVCGELTAALSSGRKVYLYFLVGTARTGVIPTRGLYGAFILAGDKSDSLRSLAALATALRGDGS